MYWSCYYLYDLLFSRVSQLVLPPAVVALLNPRIGPKGLYSFHVRALKGRHTLKVD